MNLSIWLCSYLVLALIGGCLMARASMQVLRDSDEASTFVRRFLFPINMRESSVYLWRVFDRSILLPLAFGDEYWRIQSDKSEDRQTKMIYILLTCFFLPIRLSWCLLAGGVLLMVYSTRRIWRWFTALCRGMTIKLTNV